MSAWPDNLPTIELVSPNSILARGNGNWLLLQKDVSGIGQQVTYIVTKIADRGGRPIRKADMSARAAIERFVDLYWLHIWNEAA